MSETFAYFAYGSNMLSERLERRVGRVRKLGVGRLGSHRLAFHKTSKDGSAKCDAYETRSETDYVLGVLYELSTTELEMLDKIEGVGAGYRHKDVAVVVEGGGLVRARTYVATSIDEALKPFTWYKDFVLAGAKEHGLDAKYVAKFIREVPADEDPDRARDAENRR